MSDAIDLSPELLLEPALIEALKADTSTAEKVMALARLQQQVEKNRASLQEHAGKINEMSDKAGRDLSVEDLAKLAARVHEAEKGAAERLDPWIKGLQRALLAPSQEGRQHIEELIEISATWLAIYQEARARLLNMASGGRATAGKTLRARPVPGDIDHDALSREFMARFPKIRATLAK